MRWDVRCVRGDGSSDCVDEHGFRDGWDGDEARGVLHALGVAVGAEDCDASMRMGRGRGVAEGFEAFVGLLAVVEGRERPCSGM